MTENTFKDAGADELFKDLLRVGPAPNASREAFVTVVNVALAAAIVALLEPPAPGVAVVAGLIALYTAARWIAGTRRWRG